MSLVFSVGPHGSMGGGGGGGGVCRSAGHTSLYPYYSLDYSLV